jgi:predicted nucleotidyltransferase
MVDWTQQTRPQDKTLGRFPDNTGFCEGNIVLSGCLIIQYLWVPSSSKLAGFLSSVVTMLEASVILSYLQQKYKPELVLLGGSRAEGTACPQSDWDLYLIGAYHKENQRIADEFEGAYLDIALFPKMTVQEGGLKIYYGPLRTLKVLLDNEVGEGAKLVAATTAAYGRGPDPLNRATLQARMAEMRRLLSKIEVYFGEATVSAYHIASFYQLVLPTWFEVRGEWSMPPHLAIPRIKAEDPTFFELIRKMTGSGEPKEQLAACQAIFASLFSDK